MEAIILAGGFGMRLQHVVSDVPKPMAPLNDNKPFLQYILDYLIYYGVDRIVLAVGYKKECIIDYFGKAYKTVEIVYSIENDPLFTGGAIKKALQNCKEESVFILNGDTFFDVDLVKMRKFHQEQKADLTIATKEMFEFDRYGTIVIKSGTVHSFEEKKWMSRGYINGGIYYMKTSLLKGVHKQSFSIEKDFIEKEVMNIQMKAFQSDGYFVDIGIPEDYFRAKNDLTQRNKSNSTLC